MGRRTWQGRWGTAGGCMILYNYGERRKRCMIKVPARRPEVRRNSGGSATGADPLCRIRDPGSLPLWSLLPARCRCHRSHGSPKASVFTRFRCLRWWHSGICGASFAPGALSWDPGEGPEPASERPWGSGRPRPPGRPKPNPPLGQFPQAHTTELEPISYRKDPGDLPPPKAGKPEMC